MWDDSTCWIDETYWTDTDELAPVTVTTVIKAIPRVDVSRIVTSQAPTFDRSSAGEITATTEIKDAIKAGYALIDVFVVENNGEPCTIKGGTTAGGDDWFTSTGLTSPGITSIPVDKMLSTSSDLSLHITVTSGAGFSLDVYCLTSKII